MRILRASESLRGSAVALFHKVRIFQVDGAAIPSKTRFSFYSFILVFSSLSVLASPHAFFGGVSGDVIVEVTSYKEAKYRTVIKQKYDFSCGSAALATLLTYHYKIPTSEEDAFRSMFEAGDQAKIREKGFSLLDMKNYLMKRGIRADGYKIPLRKLVELGVPAIVLINTGGYKHFVVVKGVEDGMVLVGDPAKGLKSIPEKHFNEISQGIVFLIKDKAKIARASFNDVTDWKIRAKAPIRAADGHVGVSTFPLMLPGLGDF